MMSAEGTDTTANQQPELLPIPRISKPIVELETWAAALVFFGETSG